MNGPDFVVKEHQLQVQATNVGRSLESWLDSLSWRVRQADLCADGGESATSHVLWMKQKS
jgi:hypothetical protein